MKNLIKLILNYKNKREKDILYKQESLGVTVDKVEGLEVVEIPKPKFTKSEFIIIGESGSGSSFRKKLNILKLIEDGETFSIIDNENKFIQMAKNLGANIKYLDDTNAEITFNPTNNL